MIRFPLPELRAAVVAHFRRGPECARGGCHRTGAVETRFGRLCGECWSASLRPPVAALRPDELPGANQDAGGIPVAPTEGW